MQKWKCQALCPLGWSLPMSSIGPRVDARGMTKDVTRASGML